MEDKIKEETLRQILRVVPVSIRGALENALRYADDVQEIVLRCGQPVCLYTRRGLLFLTSNGCLSSNCDSQPLLNVNPQTISECFNAVCGYSVYSHINEIKEGFVTINGGHRVGISGTAVVSSGEIINIRDISAVSIRISREIIGCGKYVHSIISASSSGVLICGIPCSGKTTVLRDLARILSFEDRSRVSLVDTRGEIAAVYRCEPQMDVGFCDVLNGYPRLEGITQAVKVFAPEYIICDEIGCEEDFTAIRNGVNSGARFVTTAHASSWSELVSKQHIKDILSIGAFEKVVFLSGRETPGVVREIADVREKLYG